MAKDIWERCVKNVALLEGYTEPEEREVFSERIEELCQTYKEEVYEE